MPGRGLTAGQRHHLSSLSATDFNRTPRTRLVLQHGEALLLIAVTPISDREAGHPQRFGDRLNRLATVQLQQARGSLKFPGFQLTFTQQGFEFTPVSGA